MFQISQNNLHLLCQENKLAGGISPRGLWFYAAGEPSSHLSFKTLQEAVNREDQILALRPCGPIQ